MEQVSEYIRGDSEEKQEGINIDNHQTERKEDWRLSGSSRRDRGMSRALAVQETHDGASGT